jgi:hypothetical protein
MRANDRGVIILVTLSTLQYPYTVPAGSTGTLLAAPGYPYQAAPQEALGPVTFSPDGSTAFYSTQGNGLDFQSGGNWTVEVQVADPFGNLYTSPPGQFYVFP